MIPSLLYFLGLAILETPNSVRNIILEKKSNGKNTPTLSTSRAADNKATGPAIQLAKCGPALA